MANKSLELFPYYLHNIIFSLSDDPYINHAIFVIQYWSVYYFKVILPVMYLCIWWYDYIYIIFNFDAGLSFLMLYM
jgi:hypothetical protein